MTCARRRVLFSDNPRTIPKFLPKRTAWGSPYRRTQERGRQPSRRSVVHDLGVDFAEVVRSSLEAGDTPDQVAQALLEVHGLLPISAIKALRSGGGMTSDRAREIIKRNLPAERWVAVEILWEMVAPGEAGTNDGT